tara:strand:+ start:1572 stop:2054 length:483 start_codon:yes stop_codon:yes gene_type:complete
MLLSELVNDINAEQDALMLKHRIYQYALQYCQALAENYKQYRINMHQQSIINPPSGREDCRTYAAEQLAGIANGTERLMNFRLNEGKKYWKVIQQNPNSNGGYSDASVVAFISFKGEVFKPASWKAPAKGVRFDFRIIKEREAALDPKLAQWTGGSLYYR